MKRSWPWLIAFWLGLGHAQAPSDDPTLRIAAERAQLQADRDRIEQMLDSRARECWQRFAVNDCLSEVRRSRRSALEPIRAAELALNVQERAWRTLQRDERLRDKAAGRGDAP